MRTAKLFRNGKNQAVRLPKQFEFDGVNEVSIRKEGNAIVLLPVRKNWVSYATLPAAEADFMVVRPSLLDEKRVDF